MWFVGPNSSTNSAPCDTLSSAFQSHLVSLLGHQSQVLADATAALETATAGGCDLLLLDLGMLAGATTWEIFFVAIMDLIMVAMGFAAAVSKGHHATWPLFVFGASCASPQPCRLFLPFARVTPRRVAPSSSRA